MKLDFLSIRPVNKPQDIYFELCWNIQNFHSDEKKHCIVFVAAAMFDLGSPTNS